MELGISDEQQHDLRLFVASCMLSSDNISSIMSEPPLGVSIRKNHRKTSDYQKITLGECDD